MGFVKVFSSKDLKWKLTFFVDTVDTKGEGIIELFALVVNIFSFQNLSFKCMEYESHHLFCFSIKFVLWN